VVLAARPERGEGSMSALSPRRIVVTLLLAAGFAVPGPASALAPAAPVHGTGTPPAATPAGPVHGTGAPPAGPVHGTGAPADAYAAKTHGLARRTGLLTTY